MHDYAVSVSRVTAVAKGFSRSCKLQVDDGEPQSTVPKDPPLPSDDEIESDRRIIRGIAKHKDKRAPPLKWKLSLDHLQHTMESNGEETHLDEHIVKVLDRKALFYDDYFVQQAHRLVKRLSTGKKLGVVLTAADSPPSEKTAHGHSFYGNVIHNGSHFVMFHRRDGGVGRAASRDGVSWTKEAKIDMPKEDMDMHNFEGEMCVQYDPYAKNNDERFYSGVKCRMADLCVLTSPDGYVWKSHGQKYGRATDTYPCIYKDSNTSTEFTAFVRKDFGTVGGWREIRGVAQLSAHADSISSLPSFTNESEWYLDRYGKDEFRRRQVYALSRTKYSDMYIGIVQMYEFAYGSSGGTDIMRPYLITSRDGKRFNLDWLRRKPLIPLGRRNEFDHGVILTAADWVTQGGYHWLYYSGWNVQHERKSNAEARIGAVRWEQDRLIEVAPGDGMNIGWLLTHVFLIPQETQCFRIDARGTETEGSIGITLLKPDAGVAKTLAFVSLPASNYKDRCVDLFNGRSILPQIAGMPVQLNFTLEGNVSLYGFSF
eukprot:gnl/TRDRNA2_/TRDRNA2_135021_c0_seq1.p1 gnl/TRDRNA2_/TRDRNA2_135021_c0~~gnl/TRDRNA2_/TRDRNA2_135021_c0_seq1.p1  ORF type:complete len:574 (-),score=42.08 gnl/TRDRNA2_/TRDRNA2_135021_c0_seq1:155-1777(-)